MDDDNFGLKIVASIGRGIVFVRGEIDMFSGEAFRDALATARQGSADVIVDLSEVTFLGSAGVNALVGACRQVPPGGSLRVLGATPAVRRVFDITGTSELLLLETRSLTWRQLTYHTSGWRQWITEEISDGKPIAEIIEVGPRNRSGCDTLHYALESDGETALYRSLEEAMRAAEVLGPVLPQASER